MNLYGLPIHGLILVIFWEMIGFGTARFGGDQVMDKGVFIINRSLNMMKL